eukprot:CAMPEP_0197530798 /NCGR_PEP_ID=MMETSP1318-20131121/32972_1 /TAXON_ID=552666 /ORGANISM="Partenskyella glossopodia, Strain RCC365" /LENGTH=137 /DNA_ID=CAMNT_0043086773 /DNA_START=101 /DNA_END=514 /DNA_ORIENTATION=-
MTYESREDALLILDDGNNKIRRIDLKTNEVTSLRQWLWPDHRLNEVQKSAYKLKCIAEDPKGFSLVNGQMFPQIMRFWRVGEKPPKHVCPMNGPGAKDDNSFSGESMSDMNTSFSLGDPLMQRDLVDKFGEPRLTNF